MLFSTYRKENEVKTFPLTSLKLFLKVEKVDIVEINFDEASEAWKANKKSMGNGTYKYICLQKTKAGNPCKKEALPSSDFCKVHSPCK